MNIAPAKIHSFQNKIMAFYKENGRDLPWRRTQNPYFIWISEMMLQQTQVQRVLDYYYKWISKWPTIELLAAADRITVLKFWSGLGYNRRALYLHKGAQKIVEQYDGDVMKAIKGENIPGIGPYTANAIRIFAKNEDVVTVDTNIRRILLYEFDLSAKTTDRELQLLATECVPRGQSRNWHNALMDYGALKLTAKATGIRPKTTQTRFIGSDRHIRAEIIRYLLSNDGIASVQYFHRIFQKNADRARMERIIASLEKDNMITRKNNKILIST